MRPLFILVALTIGAGCATKPTGRFEAATTVNSAESELSISTLPSSATSVTIALFFSESGGKGAINVKFTTAGGYVVDNGQDFVLLGYSKEEVHIGGNVFGRMIALEREGADRLKIGDIVFRKLNEPNKTPEPTTTAVTSPAAQETRQP